MVYAHYCMRAWKARKLPISTTACFLPEVDSESMNLEIQYLILVLSIRNGTAVFRKLDVSVELLVDVW